MSTLTDADQRKYVGIATRAELRFCLAPTNPQENSTVHLVGQLINRKYAKINNELQSWRQDNVKRSYSEVGPQEACEKPFSLVYKRGKIVSMYVDKSCYRNADLNQLKGVVSQFQVNLRKAKKDDLNNNAYTAHNSSSKVFRTMEATVSGDCETQYKVSWVPAQFVNPEWYPVPQSPVEEKDSRFMRVTKRKNYDNCKRRIGFNYESNGNNKDMFDQENRLGNKIGDFFRVSTDFIWTLVDCTDQSCLRSPLALHCEPDLHHRQLGQLHDPVCGVRQYRVGHHQRRGCPVEDRSPTPQQGRGERE